MKFPAKTSKQVRAIFDGEPDAPEITRRLLSLNPADREKAFKLMADRGSKYATQLKKLQWSARFRREAMALTIVAVLLGEEEAAAVASLFKSRTHDRPLPKDEDSKAFDVTLNAALALVKAKKTGVHWLADADALLDKRLKGIFHGAE